MRTIKMLTISTIIAILSSGCLPDFAPGTGVGSCYDTTNSVCYNYTGSAYTQSESSSSCTQISGVFSVDRCTFTSPIGESCTGSCIVYSGSIYEEEVVFYTGYGADTIFCSLMGGIYSTDCPAF